MNNEKIKVRNTDSGQLIEAMGVNCHVLMEFEGH